MGLGAGKLYIEDRIGRDEDMAGLHLRCFIAYADSSAQAMADQAGCTRVGLQGMAVTKLVRIYDTLRCQHQQQQRKAQVATQCEGGKFHRLAINSKIDCGLQPYFPFEGPSKTTLTAQ
jgi:hypothetical protein